MKKTQDNVLTGSHNKRLNNTECVHQENTAAWADEKEILPNSDVAIPSLDNTQNAKDWVDDGSKL
ncbi:MAG: CDIF630_02480 family spore surface protein [Cellulosilyticaceae bacterium]